MKRQRIVTAATQAFSFSRRAWLLGTAQASIGALLAGRMAWLAIAENERYNSLSESNRVNTTLIPPRRGWIVDRHGAAIAFRRPEMAALLADNPFVTGAGIPPRAA